MSNDQAFRRMVKEFAEGQVDVVMMHIDTTRLLSADEWDLLKAAGANVVVHKSLPDEEA